MYLVDRVCFNDKLDMCTEGIHGRVSINTLDHYSIDTLVDTRSKSWLTIGRKLQLCFDPFIRINQDSLSYQLTVDQVFIECQSRVLVESIDQLSTADAFGTHDPENSGLMQSALSQLQGVIIIIMYANITLLARWISPFPRK